MSRPSLILPGLVLMLCAVGTLASPAAAGKSYPPISVGAGETCECTVMNYATSHDSNIEVEIYRGSDGVVRTCGGGIIPGQGRGICPYQFPETDTCGCQVTGKGGSVRVSIAVVRESFAEVIGGGKSARAAMECTK